MKTFCKKRLYIYNGLNGIVTESHYVTEEDIKLFHSDEFLNQFLIFKDKFNLKYNTFGNDCGYYYLDYKNIALSVYSYVNQE